MASAGPVFNRGQTVMTSAHASKVALNATFRKDKRQPTDIEALKQRTALSVLVGRRIQFDRHKSNPHRRDFWACCPFHSEKTPSFHVEDPRGRYKCFGCGASGDHFDWLQKVEGLGFREAVGELESAAGVIPGIVLADTGTRSRPADDARRNLQIALKIWLDAEPILGTAAQVYLEGRGCALPPAGNEVLRFHSGCLDGRTGKRLPAMIAKVTAFDNGDRFQGIHRTYLQPPGSGKADIDTPKTTLGPIGGGVIRLCDDAEIDIRINLAEGIETSLWLAKRGILPIWAGVSSGNMAGLPILGGLPDLSVWADHDDAGLSAAEKLTNRWTERGGWASIIPPAAAGEDWADYRGLLA